MSVLQERVKLRLLTPSLNSPKPTPAPTGYSTQGIATLVVMIAVLTIIMLFCCFAAPGIRDLCNKYVFRHCVIDDPETNNVWNRRYGHDQFSVISEEKEKITRHHSSHRRPR